MDGSSSLIGSIGILTVPTRGAQGPGEVVIRIRGGSEAFIAWSAESLPKGASVVVVNDRGTRAVDVSAWNDPFRPLPDDVV
ncbi:MAG TPA: hypothetical protein VGS19_26140 [Streptosporangiaceae bacterium]|nr:hypothetical protein [Streptosporangiaceae bacterium]